MYPFPQAKRPHQPERLPCSHHLAGKYRIGASLQSPRYSGGQLCCGTYGPQGSLPLARPHLYLPGDPPALYSRACRPVPHLYLHLHIAKQRYIVYSSPLTRTRTHPHPPVGTSSGQSQPQPQQQHSFDANPRPTSQQAHSGQLFPLHFSRPENSPVCTPLTHLPTEGPQPSFTSSLTHLAGCGTWSSNFVEAAPSSSISRPASPPP